MNAKRAFDLGILMLAAPVLVLAVGMLALLVLVLDGRPVFFLQPRVGRGGRQFHIWKLRTLTAESEPSARRPTRLGAFLRQRGLDELPQVFNVLLGEMSLVGPRPLTQADAGRLVAEYPPFVARFEVPPGITGLAQVCLARGAALTAWLDVVYARRRSAFMDLSLLLRTVWMTVVGKRRGAMPVPPSALGAGETPSEPALVRDTVRALLLPTRLIPILIVTGPLVVAQGHYSADPMAVPLGIAMCVAFVLIAPLSWRALFPDGLIAGHLLVRLALYAAIAAGVVLSLGAAVPKLTGMGATFLTDRASLGVAMALFLVGGWGLGRDIGMEARLAREQARSAALAREAERAQLLALRSHLDPHFLFNTLNAIAEWCRQDGEVAERAVLQLSTMLRAILSGVQAPSWPLERELELVKTLFELHLLRDPQLFRPTVEIAPALLEMPVPPMVLLPLVENAVKHGPAMGHRGEIRLEGSVGGGVARLVLSNPGVYRGPRPGSSGLPVVERRLALSYAGRASLRIRGEGERTVAELELPCEGPAKEVAA